MAFIIDPILLARPEELEQMRRYSDQRAARQDITRQHWAKDAEHRQCVGCKVAFTLLKRRSHCRKCGLVFCKSCTKYKLLLNQKAEYDPIKGAFHKVCCLCAKVQALGQTRSHTEYFRRERGQSHTRSNREEHTHSSIPRSDHPEIYNKLLERFDKDLQAPKSRGRFRAKLENHAKRAGLDKRCARAECSQLMLLPLDRKQCVTCEDVFCRQCTGKDVEVFRPNDDPVFEARVSVAQTVTQVEAQMPGNRRVYRACDTCRRQLHQHCQSYYFHRDLELCQAQLLDLQAQISPALDRSECKQTLKKLFDQYHSKLRHLESLKPTSSKETELFTSVCKGMKKFYITQKNIFRCRHGW